jgi:hypothetical protein
VHPFISFAFLSDLRESLEKQDMAYLPGLMPPAVADSRWSRPRLLRVSLHFSWSQGIIYSRGACGCFLGSSVGVVWRFPVSSSLLAEFLHLAVSSLTVLSLRTAVNWCSTSVYTSRRELYNYIPFSNWWRFRLVSAMFGRLESISGFPRLKQGNIPLGGQCRWVPHVHIQWQRRR